METKESLITINESYDYDHRLTESDVTMVNIYKTAIQKSRSSFGSPKPGDIVMIDSKRAHIESINADLVTVVKNAYVPFISAKFSNTNSATISTDTSGGPWHDYLIDHFVDTKEQSEKEFCFFGHCGARANGAVHFKALVNVFNLK